MWNTSNPMPDLFIPKTEKAPVSSQTSKVEPAILKTDIGKTFLMPLAAFARMPDGVHFALQEDDETILLFLRRHIITNVPWIVSAIILILFPLLINQVLLLTSGSPFTLPQNLGAVLLLFYYLAVFAFVLINFMTWFYNITIVTDSRVIDIDYSEIVYQNVAQTKLVQIEDVSYTQTGFIRSLFDYGDMFVQTARRNGKHRCVGCSASTPGNTDCCGKNRKGHPWITSYLCSNSKRDLAQS